MLKYLAVLLLFTTPVYASIGEVADIKGSGVITRDKNEIEGVQGVGLEMNDTVATANGKMELQFEDDTRVDVTEHSRMVIDEFIYDPNSGKGALSMRATLGAVRYASGQIAKNSRQRVNIRTPSATISVRGTDFMMVIDEVGSSMITLLPSCNTQGLCVTGEIAVESDVGTVIMNQAFQTTVVNHRGSLPKKPVILALPEDMLRAMLIVRKTSPYDEIAEDAFEMIDILDVDFLDFDELDDDLLADNPEWWVTDLDNSSYLDELFRDMLNEAMKELLALFQSELDRQNAELMRIRERGLDPKTGIFYDEDPPINTFRREQNTHITQLRLHQYNGYNINLIQDGFSIYGYRIGDGSNDIYINQQE